MTDEKKMTYVVQQQRELLLQTIGGDETDSSGNGLPRVAWVDIATVEVKPRTKRDTVIKEALAKAGIDPMGEPPEVRALDAESAEVHKPEAYQPPAQWRLS